jgi:hypothetical protein
MSIIQTKHKIIINKQTTKNASYDNFLKQLKVGKIYEAEAIKRIKKLNNDVKEIKTNDDNKFDFHTIPDNKTYEVKYDSLSINTGNFFIEFVGYNKPSGISVSIADFHIITDGIYYFLILTEKLKKIVENCNIRKTYDGSTFGYLLNRFDLIKNSQLI